MSDDTFELWLAQERYRSVETRFAEVQATQDRVKSRAMSLLGWSITLSTASFAAAGQYPKISIPAGAAAVCFAAVALLSGRVLYSSPWCSKGLLPEVFDTMLDKPKVVEKVQAIRRLTMLLGIRVEENQIVVQHEQKHLKRAWKALASTPAIIALAALAGVLLLS